MIPDIRLLDEDQRALLAQALLDQEWSRPLDDPEVWRKPWNLDTAPHTASMVQLELRVAAAVAGIACLSATVSIAGRRCEITVPPHHETAGESEL